MERIPISGPWITEREIAYVTEAAASSWYANANVFHERFERAFAEYVGTRYAVALPSCTSAIHLSLLSLGVGPGDEVIVPDCTWIATSAPVSYVGATPVFADIDAESWCLSVDSLESCITPRTKAVIPVDLYGNMPDMDGLQRVAKANHLSIIEDAAEAIGSEYKGRRSGSFGDTGVFSFHGSKTLTTGEGGMLVTDREEVYRRVLFLRDHGRPPGDRLFCNTEVAYKYKMSCMQAAMGLAQLERVEELVSRKREIFQWYCEEFDGLDGILLNGERPDTRNSYWMVTVLFAPELEMTNAKVMEALLAGQIDSRPFFRPLSSLPPYQRSGEALVAQERNRTSYDISPRGVNLPSALNLTRKQVERVTKTVRSIVAAA